MIGNQVLGIKKLLNIRSITDKDSIQCSEVAMQLQRMGRRPRVVFETLEKASLDFSFVSPFKWGLGQLDSSTERSNVSNSLIITFASEGNSLSSFNSLRPEPAHFITSMEI